MRQPQVTGDSLAGLGASMSLLQIGFVMAFIVLGLGLDGAFYWRFTNLLEVFYRPPVELTYRYFMFPRLIFLAAAVIVIALGSYETPSNETMIISGCATFLAFSIYPHIIIFRKSKRIQ